MGFLVGTLDANSKAAALAYTVPPGYRAVIRDWRFIYSGALPGTGAASLVVDSGGNIVYVASKLTSASAIQYGEQCQIVLHAGDKLHVESFGGPDAFYCVSGAELPELPVS